jgi:hypothetical protein
MLAEQTRQQRPGREKLSKEKLSLSTRNRSDGQRFEEIWEIDARTCGNDAVRGRGEVRGHRQQTWKLGSPAGNGCEEGESPSKSSFGGLIGEPQKSVSADPLLLMKDHLCYIIQASLLMEAD